jgi:hypothetical protein
MEKKCNACGEIVDIGSLKCSSCGNKKDFTEIPKFVLKFIVDKKEISVIDLPESEVDLYDLLDGLKTSVNILSLGLKDLVMEIKHFVSESSVIINNSGEYPILSLSKNLTNPIKYKNTFLNEEEIILHVDEEYSIGPFSFKLGGKE